MTIYRLFCQCDINIPRADDLIYFRYAFRSVSKSGNRLRASDFIDFIRSGFFCRNKCGGSYFSVFSGRSNHYDFSYSRCFCRNDIHKNRRRVCSFPSRHIYAYPIESRHFLTKDRSVRFTVKPTVLSLFFMIRLNIFQSLSDYLNQSSVDLSISFFNFFFFYKNRLLIKTEAVEFFCIFKKGFISSFFHII